MAVQTRASKSQPAKRCVQSTMTASLLAKNKNKDRKNKLVGSSRTTSGKQRDDKLFSPEMPSINFSQFAYKNDEGETRAARTTSIGVTSITSSQKIAFVSPRSSSQAHNSNVSKSPLISNNPCSISSTSGSTTKMLAERTNSFGPKWHGIFDSNTKVKVHTLILGTHPSITSLGENKYFAHPMNAFWWIAGDCLGFRRAPGISTTGKPYKFSSHLIYGPEKVLPYEEQMELFTSKGFALWDIIESCEREGSLDSNIKEERPNEIREFCAQHPHIQRIVMANGKKQTDFFNRHFKDWWLTGELKIADNEYSLKSFKKWKKVVMENDKKNKEDRIECICLPSVSPAAASISYEVKRDNYRTYCYEPGLKDHSILNGNST